MTRPKLLRCEVEKKRLITCLSCLVYAETVFNSTIVMIYTRISFFRQHAADMEPHKSVTLWIFCLCLIGESASEKQSFFSPESQNGENGLSGECVFITF